MEIDVSATPLNDVIDGIVTLLIFAIPGNTAGGAAAVTTGAIAIILAKSPLVNVLLPNPMKNNQTIGSIKEK